MLFILAACNNASSLTPTPTLIPVRPTPQPSAWGEAVHLARAEQADGPAIVPVTGQVYVAWASADHAGVHTWMRVWDGVGLSSISPITVHSLRTSDRRLYPGGSGFVHLLWFDRYEDETRLFSAAIDGDLTARFAPPVLSDKRSDHYTALPAEGGGLWVVWSGGLLDEPLLHLQWIDPLGRAQLPVALNVSGDWPVLMWSDESQMTLFWMDAELRRVFRGMLADNAVVEIQPLVEASRLKPGDRLAGFSAGRDMTHTYLFWNITRADGVDETFYASGAGDNWSTPALLSISVVEDSWVETGFETAQVAASGDIPLAWAVPLQGRFDMLPVAALSWYTLSVVYFQQGQIRAYQPVVQSGPLIGPPSFAVDESKNLYLAWSEPRVGAPAELKFVTTR